MQICETLNNATGARRYYADGKRISRALLVAIKGDSRLDCFQTVTRGTVTRHYCQARKVQP